MQLAVVPEQAFERARGAGPPAGGKLAAKYASVVRAPAPVAHRAHPQQQPRARSGATSRWCRPGPGPAPPARKTSRDSPHGLQGLLNVANESNVDVVASRLQRLPDLDRRDLADRLMHMGTSQPGYMHVYLTLLQRMCARHPDLSEHLLRRHVRALYDQPWAPPPADDHVLKDRAVARGGVVYELLRRRIVSPAGLGAHADFLCKVLAVAASSAAPQAELALRMVLDFQARGGALTEQLTDLVRVAGRASTRARCLAKDALERRQVKAALPITPDATRPPSARAPPQPVRKAAAARR